MTWQVPSITPLRPTASWSAVRQNRSQAPPVCRTGLPDDAHGASGGHEPAAHVGVLERSVRGARGGDGDDEPWVHARDAGVGARGAMAGVTREAHAHPTGEARPERDTEAAVLPGDGVHALDQARPPCVLQRHDHACTREALRDAVHDDGVATLDPVGKRARRQRHGLLAGGGR